MNRILIGSHHGLGDQVLLTPALRKFKEEHPDTYIAIACMKRFGDKVGQLLSGLPYVDEVMPILSDAWNDYRTYNDGVHAIQQEVKEAAEEFDNHITLLCPRKHNDYRFHKIFRFADELGVTFSSVDDLRTELVVQDSARENATNLIRDIPKPILILHNKAGNLPKEIDSDNLWKLIRDYRGYTILEFGKKSFEISLELTEDDMEFTKAIIEQADAVVAIDSVVMHIAGALNKYPLVALFQSTPVHQAVPLHTKVILGGMVEGVNTQLKNWPVYRKQISDHFNEPMIHSIYNRKEEDHVKRFRAMEHLFTTDRKLKVLDIGCNVGTFSIPIAELGHDVIGIDNDNRCLEEAKSHSENVFFFYVDDLLAYLEKIEDNCFDYTLYLSVHHHIYEQYSPEIADKILNEISRVSHNVIFEMATTAETGSEWTPWIKLIPKFDKPKMELVKYVLDHSKFRTYEILTSTTIHDADRWMYLFKKDNSTPSDLTFDDIKYDIAKYMWRGEGSSGDLKISADGFPDFDADIETKVRYYLSDNIRGSFFVKEILYQPWLKLTPLQAAENEFARGQILANADLASVKRHTIVPFAIHGNRLIMDRIAPEWKRIDSFEEKSLPEDLLHRILRVAERIADLLQGFDFNANNIFISPDHDDFKIVDFGYGYCDYNARASYISRFFDVKSKSENVMSYKNLFTGGPYGGRWNIDFGLQKGSRVLDIGAGNKPYPFATDIIELADNEDTRKQRHGRKAKSDGKTVHTGKAEDVLGQFDDNYFDFIYTSHTIEHIDDLPKALMEMSRVGKRGIVIAPHYYIDLWDNNAETGHKWFIDYDHKRNVLKIRRRQPHEFIPELNELVSLDNEVMQNHSTKAKVRSLWEIRFYWENGIDFEIDEDIYEESKYAREKWGVAITPKKEEDRPMKEPEMYGELQLPLNYYHGMSYWAHMITFRCNGNCEFCIVDGRGEHAPREEIAGKDVLEWWNKLRHRKGHRLSIIGGEPTLHKDVVEIINNLEGYNITITTNCKGPFYKESDFANRFKPLPSSTLRINTSYHPHAVSPEQYIRVIKAYQDAGHFVDQTAFVSTPDVMQKYKKEIEQVNAVIPLTTPPFLGFWNEKDGYSCEQVSENLLPDENYYDQDGARYMCGISDYPFYRSMCGQNKGKHIRCGHPLICLLVDPAGDIFGCHYRLYYNLGSVGNIFDFKPVTLDDMECDFYGFCNWCDYPRFVVVNSRTYIRAICEGV